MKLSILIPAHNEQKNITNLLKDILNSSLDTKYEVLILENGSTDDTVKRVKGFIDEVKMNNFRLIELKTSGKTKALNKGIKESQGEIIMQIDSDCRIKENTIALLINELENPLIKLIGALDVPTYESIDKTTLLYKTLRSQELYRLARGRVIPIGRCLAFKRDLNIIYPEDIHSEDNWLTLNVAKKFGWEAVKVLLTSIVAYKPPLNWGDFLRQETRFDQGYLQIMAKFPEFEEVYNSRRKNKIDQNSIINQVIDQLKDENIEKEIFFYFKDILSKIITENSESTIPEFQGGSWNSINSTK